MPMSEPDGYAQGHFSRVYDYIIAPACKAAGLTPVRLEEGMLTDGFALIKTIIDTAMVICDLSSANKDVLYCFAVRRGCDLPLTLLRDSKGKNLLNIQDMGELEYDDSLRIDTVQKATETIGQHLKNSITTSSDIISVLSKLGIGSASSVFVMPPTQPSDFHFDSAAYTETAPAEEEVVVPSIPIISPLPEYVGEPITEKDIDKIKAGDFLFHISYGKGEISSIKNLAKEKIANIVFESGPKFLVLGTTGYFRKVIG